MPSVNFIPCAPLEDTVADVLRKAMRGLGVSSAALAAAARVPAERLAAVLAGSAGDAALFRALAGPLELAPEHLAALAAGNFRPEARVPGEGFAGFNSPFGDGLTVNHFLFWEPRSRDAVLFDTGTDAAATLDFLRGQGLRLREIFLTHAHHDHVAALAPLARVGGRVGVHICSREPQDSLRAMAVPVAGFEPGAEFSVGGLSIRAVDASGHTPGQTAFYVRGLECPVVVSGDALFAGSMGGADLQNYRRQRRNTAENILTLPGETLVAPGHGPLSRVADERAGNPVFAK